MTRINGVAIEEVDTVGELVGLRHNCADAGKLFRAACDASLARRGEKVNDGGFRQQIQTDLQERWSRIRRRRRK